MKHASVGHSLFALGATASMGKDFNDINKIARASFNPDGTDAVSRYGKNYKGSIGGESAQRHWKLLALIEHESNPLQLADQKGAAARLNQGGFDGVDAAYACQPGAKNPSFYTIILPMYDKVFGIAGEQPVNPNPRPRPKPKPTPDPAPLPTPTPDPTETATVHLDGGTATIKTMARGDGALTWTLDTGGAQLTARDTAVLAGELLRRSHPA